MGNFLAQVGVFKKMGDLCHKTQSLQPAWLKAFFNAVGAHRAFIWGKAPRHPPYKRERSATILQQEISSNIRGCGSFNCCDSPSNPMKSSQMRQPARERYIPQPQGLGNINLLREPFNPVGIKPTVPPCKRKKSSPTSDIREDLSGLLLLNSFPDTYRFLGKADSLQLACPSDRSPQKHSQKISTNL